MNELNSERTMGFLMRLAFVTLVPIAIAGFASSENIWTRKHLVVVGDLHKLNQARDVHYARILGGAMADEIHALGLDYGDRVTLRSAGEPNAMAHNDPRWNRDIVLLNGGAEPADVPRAFADHVGTLKDMPIHENTDLVWALTRIARTVDCGEETSVYVVSNVLIEGAVRDGKYHFAEFRNVPFEGCREIVFFGMGAHVPSGNPNVVAAATDLISQTMHKAGFISVRFIQ